MKPLSMPQKQRGLILLLTLLFLLILTLMIGSVVKTSLASVSSTSLHQRNTMLHQLATSELLSQVDNLTELKSAQPNQFNTTLENILVSSGGTQTVTSTVPITDKVTGSSVQVNAYVRGIKHSAILAAQAANSDPVPQRSMCSGALGEGNLGSKPCYNFLIHVDANLQDTPNYSVYQWSGFGVEVPQ